MDPDKRKMFRVTIEDAEKADAVFRMLMGEDVPPRKHFIQSRATSVANATASAAASLTVTQPPGGGASQGTPNLLAGRFLEQAAYGPTPGELAHVKAIGINAWLDEQFAMPETPISNPGGMLMSTVVTEKTFAIRGSIPAMNW